LTDRPQGRLNLPVGGQPAERKDATMGILDSLENSDAFKGMLGQLESAVIPVVLSEVLGNGGQGGGLSAIVAKLQQAGLGDQVKSWIGTGQNLPIDPAALQEIFGHGQLGQIAQQLGISHEEASTGVAQMLPQVVDRMSPDGQLPDNHSDLVNDALAILQRGQR
jgi:uncharacterized protein YidB (DUF937 family)